MPTDRVLRYTLSGSTFIIFGLLFFWLLGGNLVLEDLEKIDLIKIATLILSTPLLGILISTIVFQCLVCIIGYSTYYYVPENHDIINWILKEGITTTTDEVELRNKVLRNEIKDRGFSKKLYPFYQIKVRKHLIGSNLDFLERKWAVIWVHRNIIGAIVLSFIVNLLFWFIHFYNGIYASLGFEFDLYKIAILIFILIYIILAYLHIKYTIKVATDFEHKVLMNAYEGEQISSHKSNGSSKRPLNSLFDLIINLFK